jgi:hypothetical protein
VGGIQSKFFAASPEFDKLGGTMKRRRSRTPGISRIDQLEKRTHGYFVRLARRGKIYPAFFGDKTHGGKRRALKAAQKHYRMLLRKHGRISRREWAQMLHRKGASGIIGVRRTVVTKVYWTAHWMPRPYVKRQKLFSVQKYGARRAKALAIEARKAGLRSMIERRRGAR